MKEIRIENKKKLERYINGENVIQDEILSNDDVKFVVGDNNFNTKLEVYNFDPKICANMHYSEKEIKAILYFVRCLHHEEAPDFWGNRYLKIKFKNDWNKPDSIVIDASTVWDEKKFIKAMKKVYRKDAQISLNYSNMYMSTKKRNLVSINAFSILLDYKKSKRFTFFSKRQLLIELKKCFEFTPFNINDTEALLQKDKVPFPNIIEISDRIRLIYLIEPKHLYSELYSKDKRKNNWRTKRFVNVIKRKIEKRLSIFCVNTNNDVNSFVRLDNSIVKIGSEYSKKNCNCYYLNTNIVFFSKPYDIQDIANKFIPREEIEKKRKKNSNKRKYTKSGIPGCKNYNLQRIDDFVKVQKLCNEDKLKIKDDILINLVIEQLRCMKYSDRKIIREVVGFNSRFLNPMDEKELIEICKSQLLKKHCIFKKETLRELLLLGEEECKKYGLNSFIDMENKKEHKKLYQKEYYKKKFYDKKKYHKIDDTKRNVINERIDRGESYETIAKDLEISKQSVYKHRDTKKTNKQLEIEKSVAMAEKMLKDGMKVKEIAEKLGINDSTLRKRLKKHNGA